MNFHAVFYKRFGKQECIPVGCVPPACCPYLPACTAPGECLLLGGGGGVPAPGRGSVWVEPPCEQNSWHTLLKILPCPNFVACGNNRLAPLSRKSLMRHCNKLTFWRQQFYLWVPESWTHCWLWGLWWFWFPTVSSSLHPPLRLRLLVLIWKKKQKQ